MWEELTFAQFMLAAEEMQTQIRLENGVRERIIGYIGSDWEPPMEELDISEFGEQDVTVTDLKDLPEDIRDIVLAENHRLKTKEVMTVEDFKIKYSGKEVI